MHRVPLQRETSQTLSRRDSFSNEEIRRTSFTFSSADHLSVEMGRLITLADLHSRHHRVYEAVAMAGSSQRTALLTPSNTQKENGGGGGGGGGGRLNNAGASVHEGMLMAMLTRASSYLSMGGVLSDPDGSASRAGVPGGRRGGVDRADASLRSHPLGLPGEVNVNVSHSGKSGQQAGGGGGGGASWLG
jgi:hypothetical protein